MSCRRTLVYLFKNIATQTIIIHTYLNLAIYSLSNYIPYIKKYYLIRKL